MTRYLPDRSGPATGRGNGRSTGRLDSPTTHRRGAEDVYDRELLQLIRQEMVAFAGSPDLSADLHFIEPEQLRRHVERLYLAGELSGEAEIGGAGLEVRARGLTVWGARMMLAHEERGAGPHAPDLRRPTRRPPRRG